MKTREGVGARVEWPREVVDSCYERADVTRASVNDHLSYLEKPRKYAVCEARKCYVKVCGQHKKILLWMKGFSYFPALVQEAEQVCRLKSKTLAND
jgi:hypothetical protein